MVFQHRETLKKEVLPDISFMPVFWKHGWTGAARLTPVNPNFFEFGAEVMKLVAMSLSMRKMQRDINMVASANEDIMEDQPLWAMFFERSSKDFNHLSKREKEKVCLEMSLKVKQNIWSLVQCWFECWSKLVATFCPHLQKSKVPCH